LKNITLEEVFTGIKPEIELFRLFGCPMYFHVPKEKNSKLDSLERKDTMNIQRHSRSTSLVRDRLRQAETLPLKKRQSFKDPENLRWRLTVRLPSPSSTIQRETDIISVDRVAPVDMFRDIAVGHKRPT
jgi:hypothetical protein